MAKGATPQTRLADAALRALARTPWQDLTLAQVAKSARLPVAELQTLAPAKPALLALILARLGEKTAARYRPGDGSARDRLFDVAMTWFDAAQEHKPALRALHDGLKYDPVTLIAARGAFASAAAWLMTLAGADTGPAVALRALGFAVIMARALAVWLDDDADLSKTMARLDGDLRRGESLLGRGGREPG